MAASDWLTACDTFECVLVRLGRHVNFLEHSTDVNDALNGLKSFKLKRRIWPANKLKLLTERWV